MIPCETTPRPLPDHSQTIPRPLSDHSQTIPRPFPDNSQTTSRPFPDHSQTTPRPFPDHSQTTPRPSPDHSQTIPRPRPDHAQTTSQTTPRPFPDHSQTIPRPFPDHSQTTPRPFPDHSQTLYSLSASLDVLSGRCTRCVASCSQNTHRKRHTLGWRHVHWYVFLWACLCRHHTKTVLMSHEWLSASPLFAQISFQSGQQHVLARSSLSTAWCKLEEARTLHRNVNRNVTLNLFTDTHDFMKRLVNKGQ